MVPYVLVVFSIKAQFQVTFRFEALLGVQTRDFFWFSLWQCGRKSIGDWETAQAP